jgi:predicted  nucleic acid-binding Zn-ribbon protein
LKAFKDKEKKETKALEDLVQKVEENLTLANQRAVQAEATISKLKQEIQSLKTKLAQANPQAIHKSYEDLMVGVKGKANEASQQLKAAAYKADLQIKELCQGVETLKFVSDLLDSIDGIYEVK